MYHSANGAIQESAHVFIQAGLNYAWQTFSHVAETSSPLRIFEVGFGTGLNALLTLIALQKHGGSVYYEAIERYPVSMDVVKELNYTQLLENEKYRPPFHSMHLSTWGTENAITPVFTLKKNEDSIADIPLRANSFHLIYFDAFAPETQPEMWAAGVMEKLYAALIVNGVMVTYCSKSSFRKVLLQTGFVVEKLPGPPGKREMIRAYKK